MIAIHIHTFAHTICLFFRYVMNGWSCNKFVNVSKCVFSRNILLPEFSFPLEFLILSTQKQTMLKWSGKEVDG